MEMEYVPLEEKKRLEGILLLKMRQRVSTRIKGNHFHQPEGYPVCQSLIGRDAV